MTGDTLTPAIDLSVTYPHLSPRGNNLLYLTHVAASPQVPTHVQTRRCRCATCTLHVPLLCSAGDVLDQPQGDQPGHGVPKPAEGDAQRLPAGE